MTKNNIIKYIFHKVFVALNIFVVLFGLSSIFYLRFFLRKIPGTIPSSTMPTLVLIMYCGILIMLVALALIPPFLHVYIQNKKRSKINTKENSEEESETKEKVDEDTNAELIELKKRIIKTLNTIFGYLSYPFIIFYFALIDPIPHFYSIIEMTCYNILVKINTRLLDVIFYFIPSLAILIALVYDIFVNVQIYYFYLAANLIFLTMLWKIFQIIATYQVNSSLRFLDRKDLIIEHLPDFALLSLDMLKQLSVDYCITFRILEPIDNIDDMNNFYELVNTTKTYGTNLINALLQLTILKRQIFEDPFFQPFLLFLKYGYIYIWSVIVITYILRM